MLKQQPPSREPADLVLAYCEDCEIEYRAPHCAPCPLCADRERLDKATQEAYELRRWRVVSSRDDFEMERNVNMLEAQGWNLEQIRIAPDGANGIVMVAVLERGDYSPERHAEAVRRQAGLHAAYLARREEVRAVVQL